MDTIIFRQVGYLWVMVCDDCGHEIADLEEDDKLDTLVMLATEHRKEAHENPVPHD